MACTAQKGERKHRSPMGKDSHLPSVKLEEELLSGESVFATLDFAVLLSPLVRPLSSSSQLYGQTPGTLFLTSYRLVFHPKRAGDIDRVVHVPLLTVSNIEGASPCHIVLHMKTIRTVHLKFRSAAETEGFVRLLRALCFGHDIRIAFAFTALTALSDDSRSVLPDVVAAATSPSECTDGCSAPPSASPHPVVERNVLSSDLELSWLNTAYDAEAEFQRLGVPDLPGLRIFRQDSFELCESYPRAFLVPSSVSDEEVRESCAFRCKARIPVVAWVHPRNRSVLVRCAQPLAGLRNARCAADERLVTELVKSARGGCGATREPSGLSSSSPPPPLPFVDGEQCAVEREWWRESSTDDPGTAHSGDEIVSHNGRPMLRGVDHQGSWGAGVWSTFNSWTGLASSLEGGDNDGVKDARGAPGSTTEKSVPGGVSATNDASCEPDVTISSLPAPQTVNTEVAASEEERSPPGPVGEPFYIIDARSQMAAMGNRAIGKGTENHLNYAGSRVVFMNIENLHRLRESFKILAGLARPGSVSADDDNFDRNLFDSGWMRHVRCVLSASVRVAWCLEREACSVVTHCSDGWDRTPQMVATAELLLDPHFRTFRGFAMLVEKEWCAFGHKFRDRCGHVKQEHNSEESPVFVLWLDCVWQILRQYPDAFEFREHFLIALVDQVYSARFGNFLANSAKERSELRVESLTPSIWAYLADPECAALYRNPNYTRLDRMLLPSCHPKRLQLWKQLYFRFDPLVNLFPRPPIGKEFV